MTMLILGVLIGLLASLIAVAHAGPLTTAQAAGLFGMYALALLCLNIGVSP